MKHDELIKALRRIQVEPGVMACIGCGHEHNCSTSGCAILLAAAEELEKSVPVVQCKDCKYCHIEDEYEAWCCGGLPATLTRAAEDFCSHGQRREEAHNGE